MDRITKTIIALALAAVLVSTDVAMPPVMIPETRQEQTTC